MNRQQLVQAVKDAADQWRNEDSGGALGCSSYELEHQTTSCNADAVNLADLRSNIFWENNFRWGAGTIGVNHTRFEGNCGEVQGQALYCAIDSDIEFNDDHFEWIDGWGHGAAVDTITIATHEYGHFIGLGHCNPDCEPGTGVMYPAYFGGLSRVPLADDAEGTCALYPGDEGRFGWTCDNASDCQTAVCMEFESGNYCSDTCGDCPAAHRCILNDELGITTCVREDGNNADLCEHCGPSLPAPCADDGVCQLGLPEPALGRCVTPCNPALGSAACPEKYVCQALNIQGQALGFHCSPRSADCTDLDDTSELAYGQSCTGTPACQEGLTCYGICSTECASNADCRAGHSCHELDTDLGRRSICVVTVDEGYFCSGYRACGNDLLCLDDVDNDSFCYVDCSMDESLCNAEQTCAAAPAPHEDMRVCTPPAAPPGVTDAGVLEPDGGPTVRTCLCDRFSYCDDKCDCES